MTSASDKARINQLVNVVMQVASGNYNAQVKLSGKNDDLDSLAMGLNMMIDDIKNSINIEQQNERFIKLNKELQEAKEKAEESKELYQGIFINSTIGLYQTTPEGKILSANPTLIKILKFNSLKDLLQRDLSKGSYVSHNKRDEFKTLLQKHGEITNFESEWFTKNGEIITVLEGARAIKNRNGEIIRFDGTVQDITDKKKIEKALVKAKEKAEESDKLKSAFLANMSHEIRTPMNGILGFSSLLKEPGLSGKQQSKYIALIEESGARMLDIINDLIDISKVESGQMEIYISEVNISEKVRFIVDFFQPEAEKKGLSLTCSNPKEQSDIIVKSDKAKFNAILTNLVKNAIKYTNKGTIAVSYEQVGDYIHIHVKDTGIGITDSRLNAVFDRFVQADSSISSNYEGAGLGLAISKAFAEMLGGEIWLESKIKVGSRFSFSIPNKRTIQKKKNENYQGTIKDNNAKKKIKILIAEDDLTSDLLLSTLIKEISKEILHATTGKEAIEICKQNPDIDLILMDVRMPEIDGYNATREIRKFNKDVIIIAQTAYALQGEIQKAKDAGCNDFISKPLKKITLLELINKYFQ